MGDKRAENSANVADESRRAEFACGASRAVILKRLRRKPRCGEGPGGVAPKGDTRMSRNSLAALAFAIAAIIASLAVIGASRAQTDPLKDPAVARIRDAFKVDGIALFDPHAAHA